MHVTDSDTVKGNDESGEGSPTTKRPNPVDVHVGTRVRLRRMLIGMSQERLGELMGLTFQQIQKYEKGVNRVGASRLHRLSRVLSVPVQFFFEELPQSVGAAEAGGFAEATTETYIVDFLNSREGLELNRAFIQIADSTVRKRVVDLVKSLAGVSEPPPDPDRSA